MEQVDRGEPLCELCRVVRVWTAVDSLLLLEECVVARFSVKNNLELFVPLREKSLHKSNYRQRYICTHLIQFTLAPT